jgi:hypothetical protein
MPDLITVKIDVSKIDKAKLFKGAKATYLDLVLIPKESKYGDDYMVVQGLPKAERDAGAKGAILGNGKIMGQRSSAPEQQSNTPSPAAQDNDDSDVPF